MTPPLAAEVAHSRTVSTETTPSGRVVRACARCRKQKLKCDPVRPCALCRRSHMRCEPQADNVFSRNGPKKRKRQADGSSRNNNISQNQQHAPSPSENPERQRFGANSSAVGFAAHIFGNLAANHSSDISSIPGHAGRSARTMTGSGRPWSLATMRRPPVVVLEALLDAFFDRMHWFILIFHESSFRHAAGHALSNTAWQREELGTVMASLAASVLGLMCVARDPSWTGHALLAEASLEACSLIDALIQEIRFHLLDLLDDCRIETVQVCSLLGAYYMYHASPALAWSVLGMAVRTAYALALHCDDDGQGYDPITVQVRRRTWNHITVSDTFAAMIYGRPVSLDAAFSLVQPLGDLDDTSLGPTLSDHALLASVNDLSPDVTQLTFHVLKFRLYEIIRQALNRFRVLRLQNPISPEDLISLVQAVQYIRSLLEVWRAALPPIFHFEPGSGEPALGDLANVTDLPPAEQKIHQHLLYQVLTLQVTYDGAVIFVHRPLLEYRIAAGSRQALPSEALQVAAESLHLSVNAALRMSRISVVELEKQFAISFVLMNFFTAGVILCIPPTTWPLSSIAHEAKAGTLRIIRANRNLKHVSQIARHTEQLLTRLLKLSLQLEVDNGLQQDDTNSAEGGNLPLGITGYSLQSSGKPTLLADNEAQARSALGMVTSKGTSNKQMRLGTQSEQLAPASPEPLPATSDQSQLPLQHGSSIDGDIHFGRSSIDPIHNEASGSDFRWPTIEVDSQLDETFGTFGQMLFNLVPNDPYSAWSWGSGGF
ncbi:fatty acid catabolic regulatory protein [Xylogone sp. PMI_703]|nr:fatty acid catabolic regulatory protein [Xylogone sp. PMI_703]